MEKVILTGASGFVGSHCLQALTENGFEVHAVSSSNIYNNFPRQVEWHLADLHDLEQILRLMEAVKPAYLLHLAWDVTPGVYWHSLDNLRWVKAGVSLLQAFINSGGKRIVMAGSCAEYDWQYGYFIENISPLKPNTLYGVCKNALQEILHAAAGETGICAAWGRLFSLYGPGENKKRLLPEVICSVIRGKRVAVTHGRQIRDYLYIKDAAAALVKLLQSNTIGAVNIASGQPIMLNGLIKKAAEIVGRDDLVDYGAMESAKDEPPFIVASTYRLNEEIGWRPQYDLDKGLRETIAWWEEKLAVK